MPVLHEFLINQPTTMPVVFGQMAPPPEAKPRLEVELRPVMLGPPSQAIPRSAVVAPPTSLGNGSTRSTVEDNLPMPKRKVQLDVRKHTGGDGIVTAREEFNATSSVVVAGLVAFLGSLTAIAYL